MCLKPPSFPSLITPSLNQITPSPLPTPIKYATEAEQIGISKSRCLNDVSSSWFCLKNWVGFWFSLMSLILVTAGDTKALDHLIIVVLLPCLFSSNLLFLRVKLINTCPLWNSIITHSYSFHAFFLIQRCSSIWLPTRMYQLL